MTSLFRDPSAGWAALLIVVLPLVIIGAGEVEERLRQSDSPFRPAISIVRAWVVPLVAVWALIRALFDVADTNLFVQLLSSALVISIAIAGLSALAVVAGWLGSRTRDGRRSIPRLILALPRLGVILASVWFLIAGVWAVDLSALLTALGVTSLVISFALQDTLSGVASGFLLLTDQPFKTGDWIEVGDIEGRVLDTNWRSSRIQDRNGDLQIVPNAYLANANITNFDEPTRLHRVVVSLQVAYLNSPTAAMSMLLDTARSTPGVLEDPPPNVVVKQIDDPLMGYDVQMWVDDYTIAPRVKSDFGALVWYHSHRHEVPLPSPAQDLYLYDGVKVGLEGKIEWAELRRRIQTSPPFDELDADDLDLLATSASVARYAGGETMLVEGSSHDLHVLYEGRARLLLRDDDSEDLVVLELEAGDVFGVLESSEKDARRSVVVATDDSEIVIIGSDAASSVISRTPALANAMEQLATTRRRRISRALRRFVTSEAALAPILETPDSDASEESEVAE